MRHILAITRAPAVFLTGLATVLVIGAGAPGPATAQDADSGQGGLLTDLWGITPQDRENPPEYGEKLVQHLGCLYCHGLGGQKGITNPNAKENKNVPSWDSPDFAEKYPTEDKVRDTIQKGRHPDAIENADTSPIPMPPWGNRLSDPEVDAIVAYILSLRDTSVASHPEGGRGADDAESAYLPGIPPPMAPPEEQDDHAHKAPRTLDTALVRKGASLVDYLGCLHCHGLGGREGMDNPNAKRKHVPAWDDPEFIKKYPVPDGVRWVIEKGRTPERDPDATDNPVPMPAFGNQISDDELDAIVAYIWSLRDVPETARMPAHDHDHAHGDAAPMPTAEHPAAP
jgi:mono/diheme cytochrome c family protein